MYKKYYIALAIAIFFAGVLPASAQVVDDFDSYTDGDLTGQGSWSGDVTFDVEGTVFQAGTKAVKSATTNDEIVKTFTLAATGMQTVWGRISTTNADAWALRMKEGASERIAVRTNAGNLEYYNGASYVVIGAITVDTWFQVDIDWDFSQQKARYRLNAGTWTAFANLLSNMTAGISGMALQHNNGAGDAYYDSLADGNTPPATESGSASSTSPFGTATTTYTVIDNPTQDYFNGLALFLFGMTSIMWLFKGRK